MPRWKSLWFTLVLYHVLVPLPIAYSGWEELTPGFHGGEWTYTTRTLPTGEVVTLGSGGGSNDYCSLEVSRGDRALLRFAANTDVWIGKPRIWLEPGRHPRLLTYHLVLINSDLVGEELPGGYWLWTYDGTRYRRTAANVSLLRRWVPVLP
jgi:hypothetical protein